MSRPQVYEKCAERGLQVVDAVCPLVSKVHAEARRYAARGHKIALVGHAGHVEVEGTMGEAPDSIVLVETPEDVEALELEEGQSLAYLTQTTLSLDDTADVVDALRERFPDLVGPPSADICYATQNRQDAVKRICEEATLVLVVGSRTSSNANRLVEVAHGRGADAYLIDDETRPRPGLARRSRDRRAHRRRLVAGDPRGAGRRPPGRARLPRARGRRDRRARTSSSAFRRACAELGEPIGIRPDGRSGLRP